MFRRKKKNNVKAIIEAHDVSGLQAYIDGCSDIDEPLPHDPNFPLFPGTTLLKLCVIRGFHEGVPLLLAAGAKMDKQDEIGDTPFHLAASCAMMESLRPMLESDPPLECRNREQQTALICAGICGSFDAVSALLAAGADANAVDAEGRSTLHNVALHQDPKVVDVLCKSGADLNICENNLKDTPLHIACREGNTIAAEALVKAGADTTIQNALALEYHKFSTARVIDPQAASEAKAKLKAAKNKGKGVAVSVDAVVALADNRLAVNVAAGCKALHMAIAEEHIGIVSALLRGPDIAAAVDENGKTALMVAAESGSITMISMLAGASSGAVGAQDNDGRTALMLAAGAGCIDGVRLLFASQDTVAVKDKTGRTAVDYADAGGHVEVSKFLTGVGGVPGSGGGGSAGGGEGRPPPPSVRELKAAEAGGAGEEEAPPAYNAIV